MKNVLKKGLSLLLAVTIILSSAYVGLGEVDFGGLFAVKVKAASIDDLEIAVWNHGESYVVSSCHTSAIGELVIPSTYNGLPITDISSKAFAGCTNLTSITIPDSVTSIGFKAFVGCTNLKSITIPDSVTSIGKNAFERCTNLTSITIPDSVTSIGGYAFYLCDNLASITISDGITSIDNAAFAWCGGLTSITIPDSVTIIGKNAFESCTSLTSITIPDSVTIIGEKAFWDCTNLKSITIPDSVTIIGDCAFWRCTNLNSITIPDSVASLGVSVFADTAYYNDSNNWEDRAIYIGNHLIEVAEEVSGSYIVKEDTKTIAPFAFEGCTSLTSTVIPDSVTSIGNFAFCDCTNLTSITIPDSVTIIGKNAFESCTNLTFITIPDSVTSIDDWVFAGCDSLTTVYYSGSQDQWNDIIIGSYNDALHSANIIFNSSGNSDSGEQPITQSNGNFSVAQEYGGASNHKYDYTYKDSYFDKLATEYNHELATMSLCVALSTFHLENKNIKKAYGNVSSLLEQCGFKAEDGEAYNYSIETTPDNVGCFISQKKIGNTTLIAVAVRSGGYGKEWASNFTVGYNGDHQGFDQAADIVLERIESYIKDHKITGNVKFWITGYSRGAATATQTAAKLNYTSIDGVNFTKNQIYAYGFATPAGAVEDSDPTNLDKYGNIFNIINFHDLVPKVAPEKWNFGRYGITYYLPFRENSWAAAEKSEKNVKNWFTKENLDYKIDDFIPVYSDVPGLPLPISNDTLGVFSNKLTNDIAKSIGSRALYTLNLQNSVRAIWTKNVDITLPLALVEILVVVGSECEAQPQYLTTAIGANTLLVEAHSAFGAYYMGWMKTIPADSALEYLNNGDMRHWLFNCPVDVYVYDTDGKLVAAIEDDTVVEIEDSTFSYGVDENGQKYFYLPVDDEYDITVKAREDCETTCTVNEFSGGSFNESRVVTFTEIPMEKHEELSVSTEAYSEDDITEGTENGSSADYTIQRENEQVIEADVDITGEEIANYTYNVTVEYDENKGQVYGGGTFTIGQFCQVTAENKPGYRFSKWTVNGETVSTDSTYRFAVKEDVTIVAEYVPCEHPAYTEDVVAPTCTEDGYTKHTCEVCAYSYNDTTVKAKGHKSSSWITDKKATVYKAGSKHKECTVCDKILEKATIKQLKCSKPKLKSVSNTSSGVKITWNKVTGADSYTVMRKTGKGKWTAIKGSIKTASYIDKTAKKGITYKYTVKAKNEAGFSGYNTTGLSIRRLAVPTKITVSNGKTGNVVKWGKVTGAQGYYVMRKTGNGSWKKIATVKGVTYTDKNVKSGVNYKYTIKAYYGKSVSAYNTTGLTIKCLADPVLKEPTSTKKGITLKWNKVTGAQGYVVYRKAGNGKLTKLATVKGVSKISYVDKKAKKGTKYTYQIKAYSGKTFSAYSNAKTIKDKY